MILLQVVVELREKDDPFAGCGGAKILRLQKERIALLNP